MPETFGTGTAGADFNARAVPAVLAFFDVPIDGDHTIDFTDPDKLYVITAIDLITEGLGGGTGGSANWSLVPGGSSSYFFWAINAGENTDTFSWRGWLPIPGGLGWVITIETLGSYGDTVGVMSGFTAPQVPTT